MDPAGLDLGAGVIATAWVATAGALGIAAFRADWKRLFADEAAHAYLGSLFFLVLLWSIRGTVGSASFHLLGAGALCLTAGPALALIGGAVVVAIVMLLRELSIAHAGVAFAVLVAIPVAVQTGVLLLTRRLMPRRPFAYFFVVAFAGAALAFYAAAIVAQGLAAFTDPEVPPVAPAYDLALVALLLAFAEGTLTGMLLTLAVVYRPRWVATFDDVRDFERR